MSALVSTYHSSKEPVPQNTATLMDTDGSVRPKGSFYMRIPYQSLDHVLAQMKAQVQKFKGNQLVRQKAVEITQFIRKDSRTNLPDRRNFNAIAEAVYQWMKTNIQYIRDPHGIELIQSPLKTIEYGYGDCDDQSILAASLLSSLGIPSRFKVVKANPSNPDGYSHVYVQYFDGRSWKGFDPTLHSKAGDELADHQIFGKKHVELSDSNLKNPCGCKKKAMSSLINHTSSLATTPIYDIKNGQIINDELGIPGAVVAVTKGAAIVDGAKNVFNSIFGGKPDKNYSSNSLIDAIANYEKISSSAASSIVDQMVQLKVQGASRNQIAQVLASKGGYSVNDVVNSRKWPIVEGWLNQAASQVIASQSQPGRTPQPSNASFGLSLKDPKVLVGGIILISALGGTFLAIRKNQVKAKK